jgi:hypothetical protein
MAGGPFEKLARQRNHRHPEAYDSRRRTHGRADKIMRDVQAVVNWSIVPPRAWWRRTWQPPDAAVPEYGYGNTVRAGGGVAANGTIFPCGASWSQA